MKTIRLALWPAGIVLGIGAEAAAYEGAGLAALDLAAGYALIGTGLVAWQRRQASRTGPLLAASGFAWFLGSFAGWAVYLHRGPLIHLLLAYPSGRLRSRVERAVVVAGYVYAVAYPVASSDEVTIVFALAIVLSALWRYRVGTGPTRRAHASAFVAAAAFASVLAFAASARRAGLAVDHTALAAYDMAMCLVAVWLLVDLLSGRWARAGVTGLVVDLGEAGEAGALRDRLARALGDPSLVLGYWIPGERRYVDEAGRPVELPHRGAGRAVTPIAQDGERVAVLVHDAFVVGDSGLVADVVSLARLAVSNARLQVEVRARVAEVDASRRRIVEAADAQRRRLERELREGAERRLARVSGLIGETNSPLAEIAVGLDAARAELREFARGIHPATLTEAGLLAALHELGERSPVPVEIEVSSEPLTPAIEVAVYFVCSEALANSAKYAQASRVRVRVGCKDEQVSVEVVDDGVGGADPSTGSGLRGLADRVEALGGRLRVESAGCCGTRLSAELPVPRSADAVQPTRAVRGGGQPRLK